MWQLFAILALGQTNHSPVDYVLQVKPILARHCVVCHGADKPRAKLRLDTAAAAKSGGVSGTTIVPGDPDESSLLLAILGQGDTERMPLKRRPLNDQEIQILRNWIAEGANAPENETPSPRPDDTGHWAFQPITWPIIPSVQQADWCENPIDRFILARLQENRIAPSKQADRLTLLRRVSLDLIGLPPSIAEANAFLADTQPGAHERVVDRLLASPHYGERWARLWLDMARYADSNGYSIDAPRSIWPYRDWVIDALNADMPFDQFATSQLAGDLLPNATLATRVATGFHRNTPINQEGGIDREQFRVESIIDRANTTATVFLGLTMACAQCHDHKYDPISQKEYYQLFAFFNNVDEPDMPVATPQEVATRDRVEKEVALLLQNLWKDHQELRAATKDWELGLDMVERQKQSQAVREAFDIPFDNRPEAKQLLVLEAFVDQSPKARPHKKAIDQVRAKAPRLTSTMVVQERTKDIRTTHLLKQGDFTRPMEAVQPGVPRVLPALGEGNASSRLALAHWLFAPNHPLTARVAVNRAWQVFFGRGIVASENDFGTQGALPTHPELLDWLARDFIDSGYMQKRLHRQIVTSATYKQSSASRKEIESVDPANLLLARQSRLRLEAELLRDSALVASGLLTRAIGGPSVFPPQPDGVMTLGQMRRDWVPDNGPNRYRRCLYTFLWRATPHPIFSVFDAPDPARRCTRRERSNTPLQALMLLNDQAFLECAQALAKLAINNGHDDESRIRFAFRRALAREATTEELASLRQLLDATRAADPKDDQNQSEAAAWLAVARVVLNLDEFLTRE